MKKINLYGFADEISNNFDEQISGLINCGLNGLEIRNVDGESISDISLSKAREVKKKLDSAGLVAWSVASPIGKVEITDDNAKLHIEKLEHTLEICKIIGSHNIRLFSYYIPAGISYNDCSGKIIESLTNMNEIAVKYDVVLCLENEKGLFGDIPERTKIILDAIPEIKCVFDPANYVQCNVDIKKSWQILSDRVEYLHIKDANITGTIVPAGEGDAQIEYIIKKYIQNGGSNISIEPHLVEFDGLSSLERDGERSIILNDRFSDPAQAFIYDCHCVKQIISKATEVYYL